MSLEGTSEGIVSLERTIEGVVSLDGSIEGVIKLAEEVKDNSAAPMRRDKWVAPMVTDERAAVGM